MPTMIKRVPPFVAPRQSVAAFGPGYGPSWDPGANYHYVDVDKKPTRPLGPLFGMGDLSDTLTNPWFLLVAGFVGYKIYKHYHREGRSRQHRYRGSSETDVERYMRIHHGKRKSDLK